MVKIYDTEDKSASSIIKSKIPNLRSFEIDILHPNAKLTVWITGAGKGLGKGGPKLNRETYLFVAEDGDNYFSGVVPQLDGFVSFHLLDHEIEIYAKGEVTSYVSFKHNSSINTNLIGGGKKKIYKGREYKIWNGKQGGKYINVKGKKVYV